MAASDKTTDKAAEDAKAGTDAKAVETKAKSSAKSADAKAADKNAETQETDSLGRPADAPAPEIDPGDMFTDAAQQVQQDVLQAKERADKGESAIGTAASTRRQDDPDTEARGGLIMSDESDIAVPNAE